MKATIKITNETLYNSTVRSVDTSLLKCTDYNGFKAVGNLEIETVNGIKEFDGEHGANDFKEDYGFVIITTEK